NAASVATSARSAIARRPPTGGRRVQSNTLSGCGSPEATPCGKRSRRSSGAVAARATACGQANAALSAAADAAASASISRRVIVFIELACSSRSDIFLNGNAVFGREWRLRSLDRAPEDAVEGVVADFVRAREIQARRTAGVGA